MLLSILIRSSARRLEQIYNKRKKKLEKESQAPIYEVGEF